MIMAMATIPYSVHEEEEDDATATVNADEPVDQQPEAGVNVVVPANEETFVLPFHLPPMTRPSSARKPVENPPSCTKTATQTLSAYDVWIQNPTLKKQETGLTDVPSETIDAEHWKLSGWRVRRSRRRVTFLAIMFLLGLLTLIISLAVGLAQKQGADTASVSADQPFPRVAPPCNLEMNIERMVVLESDSSLERGMFVHSPNEQYKAGLGQNGDFMLKDRQDSIIWSTDGGRGERLFLQSDGNLILRASSGKPVWDSGTNGNAGAVLVVDDSGLLSIVSKEGTKIWFDGIPRGVYDRPTSPGLTFPTRGIFYYPWFPATFYVNGEPIKFESDLGRYSSSDADVAKAHIDSLDYARINLSIASWWGPDTHLDRARLTMLMDETIAMGSPLKWTVYHEDSQDHPSSASIRTDLEYLKKWFAWHPTWAHVDGRPVIFAYNEDGCDVVNRWMDASNGEWYVVLKLFPKFKECDRQPDHWVSQTGSISSLPVCCTVEAHICPYSLL